MTNYPLSATFAVSSLKAQLLQSKFKIVFQLKGMDSNYIIKTKRILNTLLGLLRSSLLVQYLLRVQYRPLIASFTSNESIVLTTLICRFRSSMFIKVS